MGPVQNPRAYFGLAPSCSLANSPGAWLNVGWTAAPHRIAVVALVEVFIRAAGLGIRPVTRP
jgi:hypothetical protein